MILQIYGIMTPEDAVLVAELGADHIGVVVGDQGRTPDEVNVATARTIFAAVPPSTVKVALTVAADLDEIEALARNVRPDILHLAADLEALDPQAMGLLRARLPGLPLMRAIPVTGQDAVDEARRFQETSDYLLLDTKAAGTTVIGATGQIHDWSISRQIVEQTRVPVILAGGLSPENVAEAIRIVRPWGVDSNTQTNRPGTTISKDPECVRQFVERARRMAARPVLAIGEVGRDWIIRVPVYPTRGDNAWGPAPERHAGGATANVAVGLARLGAPVSFWGKVGDDEPGRLLLEDLGREGVDTRGLGIAEGSFTQVVIAIVDAEGERTFFVCSQGAAHTKLRPQELDPDAITGAAWLHTSGTSLSQAPTRDAILYAMGVARDHDVPVSLDVNVRMDEALPVPFRDAVMRAIPLADVVLGSAGEVTSFAPASSMEASALALADGKRTVVARLGPEGALAASSAGVVTVAAFPTQVMDTVGAGDAFDAGFIAARVTGFGIEPALGWGNAAAALKIARPGARGLPNRAEVEDLLHG